MHTHIEALGQRGRLGEKAGTGAGRCTRRGGTIFHLLLWHLGHDRGGADLAGALLLGQPQRVGLPAR